MTSGSVSTADTRVDRPYGTRERILDVARERFLANGYAGTSLSSIGKELGISAPAVYWHFASKEQILYELLTERLLEFIDAVDIEESSSTLRLDKIVRRWVRVQLDEEKDASGYSHLSSIAQSGQVLKPSHAEEIRGLQRVAYEKMSGAIRSGIAAGEFTVKSVSATAFAIINMCEGVTTWVRPDGNLSPAEVEDIYGNLALRMVGAALS